MLILIITPLVRRVAETDLHPSYWHILGRLSVSVHRFVEVWGGGEGVYWVGALSRTSMPERAWYSTYFPLALCEGIEHKVLFLGVTWAERTWRILSSKKSHLRQKMAPNILLIVLQRPELFPTSTGFRKLASGKWRFYSLLKNENTHSLPSPLFWESDRIVCETVL